MVCRLLLTLLPTCGWSVSYVWNNPSSSGLWTDAAAWAPNGTPGAADDVTIEAGSVELTADVTVGAVLLQAGSIQLVEHVCEAGWEARGSKCYKAFAQPLAWKDAEYVCQQFSQPAWHNCMETHRRDNTTDSGHLNLKDAPDGYAAGWKGLPNAGVERRCTKYQDGHLVSIASATEAQVSHPRASHTTAFQRAGEC
jgi:hypothetical protein